MDKKDIINAYLSTAGSFDRESRLAIRYWLTGKGVITADTVLAFKDGLAPKLRFDDFAEWFENYDGPRDWTEKLQEAIDSKYEIQVGDFVKVYSLDNPRSEYVVAITEVEGTPIYCLADNTFVQGPFSIGKYKIQGAERFKMIDSLNETL